MDRRSWPAPKTAPFLLLLLLAGCGQAAGAPQAAGGPTKPPALDPRICNLPEVSVLSGGKPLAASDATVITGSGRSPVAIEAVVASHPDRYALEYLRLEVLAAGVSALPDSAATQPGDLLSDTLPTVAKAVLSSPDPGRPATLTLTLPGAAAPAAGSYQVAVVAKGSAGTACPAGTGPAYVSAAVATVRWAGS